MPLGSLNLKVSKSDFVERVTLVEQKMEKLMDVIAGYKDAKSNLDQFVESTDSTYQDWVDRIDVNIKACQKAWTSLKETRDMLQSTVDKMDDMKGNVQKTVKDATEAAKTAINAAIKVDSIL